MIIAQRFETLELAGQGGMGDVYRARDRATGAQVAVKMIRADSGASAQGRFHREAAALASLSHPGIVGYVAHGTAEDGRAYLAMEWLEGKTLAARLAEGPVPARDVLTIVKHVAEAVGAAHQRGLVHRDLKPTNVVLVGGQIDRVKVLDFGLVRGRHVGVTITQADLVGTPAYMSPEQAIGQRVDARADVFALGAVLFECLAGRRPFEAEVVAALLVKIVLETAPRLDQFRPSLPMELVDLVARMLSKEPSGRPVNGLAVASELELLDVVDTDGPDTVVTADTTSLTPAERRFQCVILAHRIGVRSFIDETITIDEQMPPPSSLVREVAAETARDAHLDVLRRVAERHGARVDRLLDGTLMVAFASGTATDLAMRAARCALALQDVGPGLAMALAAGWALSQGGSLSGDLPDQAVALLQRTGRRLDATPGIRINALAGELLGDRFETELGADGERLLRAERAQLDGGRALLGRVSPFVGRARELASLTALLDACIEESVARVALVTADAGMGKSRLRHEFVRLVRERGVETWTAAASPQQQGSAYAMLAQVIRQAASITEGEPLDSQRQKLAERVNRVLADGDLTTAALLGELIAAPFPESEAPLLRTLRHDPSAMGDQTRAACARWLAAEVVARPLLIILEDLHWGDQPTVRLLDEVLGHERERPLLVLGLARPEVHAQFTDLWTRRDVQEIRLTALTRKASESLVEQTLSGVSPAVATQLAERAQGNAFFLEELIRATARGQTDALPDTVLAMMQRRLEAQPAVARYVLRVASIFGRDFWAEGVAALAGGSRRADAVREHLALMVDSEILSRVDVSRFPGMHQYRFRHDLVRDATSTMLAPEDRSLGHRMAAAWLERAGETDPLVLADHHERGGDLDRAVTLYTRAALHSTQAGDTTTSLRLIERARACHPPQELAVELHRAACAAYGRIGRFDDGEREGVAALALLPRSSAAWHHVAVLVFIIRTWQGNLPGVLELLAAMRQETGGERISIEHLYCWAGVTGSLYRVGLVDDARLFTRRIEERAPELHMDEPYTSLVRFYRAYFLTHEPGTALAEARAATAELQRSGDFNTHDSTFLNSVDAMLGIGAFEEAEAALRTWLDRADLETHYTLLAELYIVRSLSGQGRLDEALAQIVRPVERFAATRNRLREGQAHAIWAELLAAHGDLAGAHREAQTALGQLAYGPVSHAEVLSLLAAIELRLGDVSTALAHAREAHAMMDTTGVTSHAEAPLRLAFAEALHASGDLPSAHAALRAARDRLLFRAATITEPAYRTSFLDRAPGSARTLTLAREWLGDDHPS